MHPQPRLPLPHPAVRELLLAEGWSPVARPAGWLQDGSTRYRVLPLASRDGASAVLCEAPLAAAIPGPAERRRLRRRIAARHRHPLVVFADPSHTLRVWSWERRIRDTGAESYRESCLPVLPRGRLGSILREMDVHGRLARPQRRRGSDPSPAIAAAVLGRACARYPRLRGTGGTPRQLVASDPERYPGLGALPAGRDGGPFPGEPHPRLLQLLLDTIEESPHPEELRALWRAVREVVVVDAAAGSVEWLRCAFDCLYLLYDSCLSTMRARLEEVGGAGRPSRALSDFRAILRTAERLPELILLDRIFGTGGTAAELSACAEALVRRLAELAGSAEPLPARLCNFAPARARGTGMPSEAGDGGRTLLRRARSVVLELRIEHGAGLSDLADALDAIAARVDRMDRPDRPDRLGGWGWLLLDRVPPPVLVVRDASGVAAAAA